MGDIVMRPIRAEDAGEVLTLQRAAFVSEAQIYDDASQAVFVQTLEQVEAELREADGFVALAGARIVGAIRTSRLGDVLQIGRIAVAPDQQGEGIGPKLLAAVEAGSDAMEAELFTGSRSEANLRLYAELGYRETERIDNGDGTSQIFMRKTLRRHRSDR